MKLEAVPYEGHRKRYFEDLLAQKHRQLDYWSKLDGFFRPEDIGMEISYIEDAISALESIDKIKAERDAAIDDLREIAECQNSCRYCSHNNEESFCSVCSDCDYRRMNNWEWRGIRNDIE